MVMDLALLLETLNPKADKASGLIYLALSQPQCIHINGIDDNPIAMWKRLEEVHFQQTAELAPSKRRTLRLSQIDLLLGRVEE